MGHWCYRSGYMKYVVMQIPEWTSMNVYTEIKIRGVTCHCLSHKVKPSKLYPVKFTFKPCPKCFMDVSLSEPDTPNRSRLYLGCLKNWIRS